MPLPYTLNPNAKGSNGTRARSGLNQLPSSTRSSNYDLDEEHSQHSAMIERSLDKRMRAMASLATVSFVIFGFSTSSLLQPNLFEFDNTDFRQRFAVLMSMTVLLSAFSGFTLVIHYYVGERLQSEGVPELAWKILVTTSAVRYTRVLADLSVATCCMTFIGAVFLKMLDSYRTNDSDNDQLRGILSAMVIVVSVVFLLLMMPVLILYQRRP
eukprot:m.22674 g.22674  ORF g.22674 m.22674 type:complete len:212 (+) comp11281_c0_seq1:132-767(+)